MSIDDVLSRISLIQQQLDQLSGASAAAGTTTGSSSATSGSATSATTDTTGATGTSGSTATTTGSTTGTTDFSNALAQAQAAGGTAAGYPTLAESEFGALDGEGTTGVTGGSAIGTSTAVSSADTGAALPADASAQMTTSQQQFAQALSADTGLNPGVVSAWLLSEESGSAAAGRQAAGNNDWLNIGYTGGADYGTSDSVWSSPTTAAAATAGWLKGQDTVPGYGTASSQIQSILSSVGQTPQAQIAALQGSGWAASGYPNLAQLYAQVAG